jgi:hypothetical protein
MARDKDDDQRRRRQVADDARRVAGFADAVIGEASLLGAELPEEVAHCASAWRHWAGRLATWAHGDVLGKDDE